MLDLQCTFVLDKAMHLAFARADPEPLGRALEALSFPEPHPGSVRGLLVRHGIRPGPLPLRT